MDPSEFPIGPEAAHGPGLVAPLFLAVLLLLTAVAYWFGRRNAKNALKDRLTKACTSIHKAILDRARAAAAATRPQVMAGAQALLDEITKLLGPVATLGILGTLAGALKGALAGEPAHGDHGHGGHGHDSHGHGGEGHGAHAATSDNAKSASAAAAATSIHINIGDVSQTESGHGAGHGKAGIDIDAIRKVVLDFTDYWSRPAMIEELKAAQTALMTPAPPPPPKPVSKPASSH